MQYGAKRVQGNMRPNMAVSSAYVRTVVVLSEVSGIARAAVRFSNTRERERKRNVGRYAVGGSFSNSILGWFSKCPT